MSGHPRLFAVQQEQLTSDDYYTPAWVFERMGIEFDLDVCAPPGGIPWIPAKRYFTQADDGLLQDWEGRVWMNPPYSNASPWAEKFNRHRDGICLVPVSTGRWFRPLWEQADGVTMYGDRPTFVRRETGETGIPLRCVFMAFGPECVEAISRLGVVRRIA